MFVQEAVPEYPGLHVAAVRRRARRTLSARPIRESRTTRLATITQIVVGIEKDATWHCCASPRGRTRQTGSICHRWARSALAGGCVCIRNTDIRVSRCIAVVARNSHTQTVTIARRTAWSSRIAGAAQVIFCPDQAAMPPRSAPYTCPGSALRSDNNLPHTQEGISDQ